MAAPSRQSEHTLSRRLFSEYYRFSFFKAVALLEASGSGTKPLGEALVPSEEAVRFKVKPGSIFPASDISRLEKTEERRAATMEVAFMGLIGPSGTLPYWYNELALERIRKRDASLVDFLDIIHHRMISLFYLAWKRHRFPENYREGAGDRLSGYLLNLTGLGQPGPDTGFAEEIPAYFSGLLSRSVSSLAGLKATLEFFTGCRVGIRQFVERMLLISAADRTRLGRSNGRLGENAVCGGRFRDCQSNFGIDLGPMGFGAFLRFLPGGDLHRQTFALVRFIAGTTLEFNVRLILNRRELPPLALGGNKTPASPRLGWSTWIGHPRSVQPRHPAVTLNAPGADTDFHSY